jgi:hypothetical protein
MISNQFDVQHAASIAVGLFAARRKAGGSAQLAIVLMAKISTMARVNWRFTTAFRLAVLGLAALHAAVGLAQPKTPGLLELREKAEAGDARLQNVLGDLYRDGKGVTQDFAEAATWYLKAANQTNAAAQSSLGLLYLNGQGVAKDYGQAVTWIRQAADQGYAEAINNVGFLYEKGHGVPQDFAEAVKWFRQAADKHAYAPAQNNLGTMFFKGQGVMQDYVEANIWFRKAAEQGYAGAQANLGVMYANGHGVPEDPVEAYKWFNLAAGQSHADGTRYRELIRKKLTDVQVAEGQRRSAAFGIRTRLTTPPPETPPPKK